MKTFFTFIFFIYSCTGHGQLWRTLGSYNYDWNSYCTLLGVVDDSLMVSGGISSIDSFGNVGTFFWDSTHAHATDWAMNFKSITAFNERIFLAGQFNEWQGPNNLFDFEASGIVSWDGEFWYDEDGVSKGLSYAGLDFIEVYNGKLYVGNDPSSLGGMDDYYQIAAYDGEQWTNDGGVGGGFGVAECMAVYNGELFVAGGFGQTSNPVQDARGIARFDGTQWYPVGEGLIGNVHALCVDTVLNRLYVGGYFVEVNGNAWNIAWWDGTDFHPMDNPWLEVEALCMYRNQLYAAGNQYALDENGNTIQTPENFYRWDGYNWHLVGDVLLEGSQTGIGGIHEMVVYKDELYVGGSFTAIDTMHARNVARYYLHPDSVQWGVPDFEAALSKEEPGTTALSEWSAAQIKVFPNPAGDMVNIHLTRSPPQRTEFVLSDKQGKEVFRRPLEEQDTRIDLPRLSPASYTYFIVVAGEPRHVGELIIQ